MADLIDEGGDTLLSCKKLDDARRYRIQAEDPASFHIEENSAISGFGEPNRFGNQKHRALHMAGLSHLESREATLPGDCSQFNFLRDDRF